MSTIILVHGAWHGSWCWHKVSPLLQQSGHRLLCPDLPGHGESPTDLSAVTLAAYTGHICQLLEQEPEPVMLVGHSMAGIVLSSVAEAMPERVRRLVYLTAFLLADGETMLELTQQDEQGCVLPNLVFARDRRSARVRQAMVQEAFYHDCPATLASRAEQQLVAEPLAPIATPVSISAERWGSVPRSYIECLHDRAISLSVQRQMHARLPCEPVLQMATGHSPFFAAANDLAGKLLQLATLD